MSTLQILSRRQRKRLRIFEFTILFLFPFLFFFFNSLNLFSNFDEEKFEKNYLLPFHLKIIRKFEKLVRFLLKFYVFFYVLYYFFSFNFGTNTTNVTKHLPSIYVYLNCKIN